MNILRELILSCVDPIFLKKRNIYTFLNSLSSFEHIDYPGRKAGGSIVKFPPVIPVLKVRDRESPEIVD